MSISALMFGRIRGGSQEGLDRAAQLNEAFELLVSQGNLPYTEITRKGQGYTVQTATAFAPVAAVPTVTAALEVFNNTSGANSQALVVKDLFAFQLLSTAATQTYSLWACVSTEKSAPTNTALDLNSTSGKTKLTTTAASFIITGVGTTIVANGWRPYGPAQAWGTAAATPGNGWSVAVDGSLIVPPSCSLLLHVAGSIATASSFQCGATIYMAPLSTFPN